MNLNLILLGKYITILSVYRVDFVPAGKIIVHREVEVHAVYQRFLTSWQRPTPKEISGYFAYLCQLCSYKLQARIEVARSSEF